jgi:hypothetical protein
MWRCPKSVFPSARYRWRRILSFMIGSLYRSGKSPGIRYIRASVGPRASLDAVATSKMSEEHHLVGYNAVWPVESQPTFRRNLSPLSSGSKNKPSKKLAWKQAASHPASLANCLHAGFLLRLFFGPEDGGDNFLRNVG